MGAAMAATMGMTVTTMTTNVATDSRKWCFA
jgi:hypothetical protein